MTATNEIYQHQKRKTRYEIIGTAKMQSDTWQVGPAGKAGSVDMSEVIVYRAIDDASLWVRPIEEFEEQGRFKRMDNAVPDRNETFAIFVGNTWHVAYVVSALEYSQNKDYPVWSEQGTTAMLCDFGKEDARVRLVDQR